MQTMRSRSTLEELSAQTMPVQAQPTMPHTPTPPQVTLPSPAARDNAAHQPLPARKTSRKKRASTARTLLVLALGLLSVVGLICVMIVAGVGLVYSGGILPGVTVAGISVGGMSQAEAAQALNAEWTTLTLRDGERTWTVNRESLGIVLDADATVADAHAQGRGAGDPFNAIFGGVDVTPYVAVNTDTLRAALDSVRERVEVMPVNAGIRLTNGQIEATLPQNGRALDIDATLNRLQNRGDSALTGGVLTLAMVEVAPDVIDSTPILQAAQNLLGSPLNLRVYDPVTGDIVTWNVAPETWVNWVTAESDANSPTGFALSVADAPLRAYLEVESGVFDATRYLDLDESIALVQDAVRNNGTSATLRVYHTDRQHTVRQGESITSIAWDYGVPYPWLQQANPGVDTLSVGQTLTIPSVDNFLPNPVVPEKRIEVSISEQRVRVYENGQMIHDWSASTGINDSPTWPGVYQIISHERNAYAGNWNLHMPYFMGVYQPVPNADFTNGFHGFPTRGGGQLLWQNSLGRRVTYGCILLSDTNAQWLYDWAETGVVVEILR